MFVAVLALVGGFGDAGTAGVALFVVLVHQVELGPMEDEHVLLGVSVESAGEASLRKQRIVFVEVVKSREFVRSPLEV